MSVNLWNVRALSVLLCFFMRRSSWNESVLRLKIIVVSVHVGLWIYRYKDNVAALRRIVRTVLAWSFSSSIACGSIRRFRCDDTCTYIWPNSGGPFCSGRRQNLYVSSLACFDVHPVCQLMPRCKRGAECNAVFYVSNVLLRCWSFMWYMLIPVKTECKGGISIKPP